MKTFSANAPMTLGIPAILASLLFCGTLGAQLGDDWLTLERAPDRVDVAGDICSVDIEADLAWGDLDGDGDTDLVIARKEQLKTGHVIGHISIGWRHDSGAPAHHVIAGKQGFLFTVGKTHVV